jgi:hypothetical protein
LKAPHRDHDRRSKELLNCRLLKISIFEDASGFHFYRMIHGNPPDQLGEPDFHFLKL